MASVGYATLSVIPSAKGFTGKLSKEVAPSFTNVGKEGSKRMGAGILGGLKAVAGPIAAALAIGKVASFVKDSVAEARDSQKVGAITANVIKTTGSAANVTATQVGNLATAISNKTGIDDEAVQSASNLLLTFTNVRNEVGKGNDIFNQATQAATDMAAAMGKEPKSAAIQLGKALNDPVKGITALSKVGVSFTKQQKDQIGTLVKSGDTLGAQKIILGELNKEFGGTAAASATAGEKLSTSFGNFKEAIGTALLPIIDKVETALTSKILPALTTFLGQLQSGEGAGGTFAKVFKTIFAAVGAFVGFVTGTVIPAVQGLFKSFSSGGGSSRIIGIFQAIVGFVRGTLIPAILAIVGGFRGFIAVVIPIVQQLVAAIIANWGKIQPYVSQIFNSIKEIIGGALAIIAAVIGRVTQVISFIWSHWGAQITAVVVTVFGALFKIVGGALKIVASVIKLVLAVIKGDWSGAWDAIKGIVSGVWQVIGTVISLAFNAIKAVVKAGLAVLKAAFSKVWNAIKSLTSSVWNGIKGVILNVVGGIKSAITSYFNGYKAVVTAVWNAIKSATSRVWSAIKTVVAGYIGGIKAAIGKISSIVATVTTAFGRVKSAISTALATAVGYVKAFPGKAVSAMGDLGSRLYGAGQDLVRGLINGVKAMAGSIASAAKEVVQGAINAAKSVLHIGSPSKVFDEIGVFSGQGLVNGLLGSKKSVAAAGKALAGAAVVKPTVGFSHQFNPARSAGVAGPRVNPAVPAGGNVFQVTGYSPEVIAQKIADKQRSAVTMANLRAVAV